MARDLLNSMPHTSLFMYPPIQNTTDGRIEWGAGRYQESMTGEEPRTGNLGTIFP